MNITVTTVDNGYLVDVDRYTASEQRYVAASAEQATRIVSAALAANEESAGPDVAEAPKAVQ